FKNIEFRSCDVPTTKILLESRRFNCVKMDRRIFEDLKDIHIDTEQLEFERVLFEEVLKIESIKTKSLVIYSNEDFKDSLNSMDISPNFQSLEKLELGTSFIEVSRDIQKVLQFLNFLNTKFVNLEILKLRFYEFHELVYNKDDGNFNISPGVFKNYVNYEEELSIYNGKVKVELYHYITLSVYPLPSEQDIKDYYEKLRKEFYNFEDFSETSHSDCCLRFKNSINVTENFETNIRIELSTQYESDHLSSSSDED
ncbi:hypothetical protein FO519_008444, partial [Halicephalobus sp. NKZ332]